MPKIAVYLLLYAVVYIREGNDLASTSKNPGVRSAYRRIEESLRTRIRQGQWPVGTMLPGRRDLAKEYEVSLVTIERAVTHLLADGTLRSDNRRGTFVADIAPAEIAADQSRNSVSTTVSPDQQNAVIYTDTSRTVAAPSKIGIIASLYPYNSDHLELNNYLVRTLVESMESAFSKHGADIQFYNRVVASGIPPRSLKDSIASAIDDGLDSIMLIGLGMDPAILDESLAILDTRHIHIVCITSSELRRPAPHVFYDNYSAGYQAAQHLLSKEHREILVVAPFDASWVQERIAGIRTAIEHANLPAAALNVFPASSHPWVNEEDPEILGYLASKEAFAQQLVPSGVICVNDGVAFGFVKAAKECSKAIGSDIGLVGFDNHPRSLSLGITSLRAPMEEMGREAARLLLQQTNHEGTGFQVRLRWNLIPRFSTRFCMPEKKV